MNIYNYDASGFYISAGVADESPLEPGVFLIPGMATTSPPPKIPDGKLAKWSGEEWQLIDIPKPAPLVPPSDEQVAAMRTMAYSHPVTGSDHLYAKALRMQLTGIDGWEDVVAQASARFEEINMELPKN